MRVMRAIAGLVLLAAVLPVKGEEILVFAAASLTDTLQEIGKTYVAKTGTAVQYSFGGSSDLARQIEAGAPADVFFSADTAKMDTLEKFGLVRHEDRREFLSNWIAVVVPADSKGRMHGPRDILQFSKIALADPAAVPAGIYAKKWLESAGIWPEVKNRVVPTLDVRSALAAVESGGVGAAVVYRTDARISERVRVVYDTPAKPPVLYSLAPVAKARPAARDFAAYLQGKDAGAVFARAGFIVVHKD